MKKNNRWGVSHTPQTTPNVRADLCVCPLEDWLDNQDVMHTLHISPRTLQTLRTNGTLPFSRIGNKLFYKRSDLQRILSDNYTMCKIREIRPNS